MKKFLRIILIVLGSVFIFSCVSRTHHVHHVHHIPPGHAKKITKSKSAKSHAPGQIKKKGKHHSKHHRSHKH